MIYPVLFEDVKANHETIFRAGPSQIRESGIGSRKPCQAASWVCRPTFSSLLNGKAGLSGDMALRIEKAFGMKMDTLMRMQSAYEIAQRGGRRS